MRPTSDASTLSDGDFRRLQEYADRFAEARSRGSVDDWEAYLPPTADHLRRHVLIELAKLDIEFTWRSGSRVLVETYETLFPELNPPPIDLIVEEYRIRHRHGDAPGLDEYRDRFPDRAAEIDVWLRIAATQKSGPKFVDAVPATLRGGEPTTTAIEEVFPPGYTPIERIGRGSFGEVWRAEAPGGIAVAVKVVSQPLDHESARKEQAALELVKRLQHPKLLSTLAFWVIQNRLVIAMELADGTLRDRLRECRAQGLAGVPPDELIPYFRDAAEGLDWLHVQGVLHRDIKPENILLKHGYAKVGDFGLAKSGPMDVMVSASFAGTPAFMAPEVWGQKACKQSDQYSLAFTYVELRLGRRPLRGDDFVSVMKSALEGVPDLQGLPDAEQAVLRRALAKRPEERFASCVEFVDALENAVFPDRGTRRRSVSELHLGAAPGHQVAEQAPTQRDTPRSEVTTPTVTASVPESPDVSTSSPTPIVWRPPVPKSASPGKPWLALSLIIVVLVAAAGGGILYLWRDREPLPTASTDGDETRPIPPSTTGKEDTNGRKSEDRVSVPSGYRSVESAPIMAVGDKKYPERVRYAEPFGDSVILRLLTPPSGKPFYIGENKVSNAIVQQFFAENPGRSTRWTNEGNNLPAMNLTWPEAMLIAEWLKAQLPSHDQLDFAAGWTDRQGRRGPFRPSGQGMGIGSSRPLPIDRDHDDVSPWGVRDLSGNGREWTRTKVILGGEEFAILRGRLFTMSSPLTFDDLGRYRDPQHSPKQRIAVPSPYTGFRIVVELE